MAFACGRRSPRRGAGGSRGGPSPADPPPLRRPSRTGRARTRGGAGRNRPEPRPRPLGAAPESVPSRRRRPVRGGEGREQVLAATPGGGEGLAATGVEDGERRVLERSRDHLQGRDTDERQPAALRERSGGGDADAQAGEAARAGTDADPVDGIPVIHHVVHQREEPWRVLGAAARRRVVARLDQDFAVEHADDRGCGGRVEREDHSISTVRASPPAWARRTRRTRRPSSSGAAASGHSTNATASGVR